MTIQLINASAHNTGLDAESVHCIVTSPPYWGLRAYAGEQAVFWPAVEYSPMPGMPAITIPAMRCGLGEESTPEAFIGHLVLVMREMWRVLRDDGTCWVNLGDSYQSGGGGQNHPGQSSTIAHTAMYNSKPTRPPQSPSLKPKDLCLIPARFALAAQADGWWLRSDIIWAKPNPMPESVTDRPTKAHEYVYLLSKSQRYFYDAEAVKEETSNASGWEISHADKPTPNGHGNGEMAQKTRMGNGITGGRNRRTVWNIATRPYSGAHFATWPPDLVRPMIQAGTSARGVCPECGAPWERVVERETKPAGRSSKDVYTGVAYSSPQSSVFGPKKNLGGNLPPATTTGWQPTCTCPPADPIPATVLDPFNGSGTSGTVALDLGRSYIGVDIAGEYVHGLAEERIGGTQIGFGL